MEDLLARVIGLRVEVVDDQLELAAELLGVAQSRVVNLVTVSTRSQRGPYLRLSTLTSLALVTVTRAVTSPAGDV